MADALLQLNLGKVRAAPAVKALRPLRVYFNEFQDRIIREGLQVVVVREADVMSDTKACPICGELMGSLPETRKTCSLKCKYVHQSRLMSVRNPTMRPEVAAKIHSGRIASGGEARRIEKLKKAHQEGKYEGQREWMRKNWHKTNHIIAKPTYCKVCGKLYKRRRGQSRKTCSVQCEKTAWKLWLEEQRSKVDRRCLNCGAKLQPKVNPKGYHSYRKTCDDGCFRELSSKMKTGDLNPIRKMSDKELEAWYAKTLGKGWIKGGGPNGFEKRVLAFLEGHQLPFYFTGDGKLWIRPCLSGLCRNPDFVCEKRFGKKVILAHGRYWHQDLEGVIEELADYRGKGWECLIIWDDDELSNELADRIWGFLEGDVHVRPT